MLPSLFPHSSITSSNKKSDTGVIHSNQLYNFNLKEDQSPLSIDACRKLGHSLTIMMWTCIIKSPMFFKVRTASENIVKMLNEYCIERHFDFSKQFLNQKLFASNDVDLFGAVNDTHLKENTLTNYFNNLAHSILYGELAKQAFYKATNSIQFPKSGNPRVNFENVRDLVLKHFEYTPQMLPSDEQHVDCYFRGLSAILDYLTSEIVQLSRNNVKHKQLEWSTPYFIDLSIMLDSELSRSTLHHLTLLPIVDFKHFYGTLGSPAENDSQLPSITSTRSDNHNLQATFQMIPTEVHSVILQQFDSLADLLAMRLVCKQWNYFVMNDDTVWKNLICRSIVSNSLYKQCDSSFTVKELEKVLERGNNNIPGSLTLQQEIINHYYTVRDWKSLYLILVGEHLSFVRDLRLMNEMNLFNDDHLKNNQDSFEECLGKLEMGISVNRYEQYNKHVPKVYGDDSHLLIPQGSDVEFSIIDKKMTLVAVLDFAKFSSSISWYKFPTTGLVYCFYDLSSDKQEIVHISNYSQTNNELISFPLNENTFKYGIKEFIVFEQEEIILPYYTKSSKNKRYSPYADPCSILKTNKNERVIQQQVGVDQAVPLVLMNEELEITVKKDGKVAILSIRKENF